MKACTIQSVLSVTLCTCSNGFEFFSLPSSREKLIWSVCLLFWKQLLLSKNCSESHTKFLFRLSFALLGRFFSMYIHRRLSEQFSESQVGYRTIFRDTGGYQKQALWRGLLEGISQLVRDFKEASRNFTLDFLHKRQLKIVKTISAHSKSTASKFTNFKKYSSRDTIPLRDY